MTRWRGMTPGRWMGLVLLVALVGIGFAFWEEITAFARLFLDREAVAVFIERAGPFAPLLFMGFQVLQVLLAPIPGEASGLVGGYLFGLWPGFFYSSFALTLGSAINLVIGRVLADRVVRRQVPAQWQHRFDRLLTEDSYLSIFVFFLFPGFPKDYLCLFLGMSRLSLPRLLLLSAVGRLPGTWLLSLQGAFFHEKLYGPTVALAVGCLGIWWGAYLWKKKKIQRMDEEKNNGSHSES